MKQTSNNNMSYQDYLSIPQSQSSTLPHIVAIRDQQEQQGLVPVKQRRGWWATQMQDWTQDEMKAVLEKYGQQGLTPNTYKYLSRRVGSPTPAAAQQTITSMIGQELPSYNPAKIGNKSVYNVIDENGKKQKRGLRNNNWGNIRINSSNNWNGKIADNTDGVFEQFSSPEYGVRAMAILLRNYNKKYGKKSIAELTGTWAPKNENNTARYIKTVSNILGVDPNEDVTDRLFNDDDFMLKLMYAITLQENGGDSVKQIQDVEGILRRGLAMANRRR